MRALATIASVFLAIATPLLTTGAALAYPERSDTAATVSPLPAHRASVVSDPSPVGDVRVLLAPFGQRAGDQFGNSVAPAGDVNGDGYADMIVGAWARDTGELAGGDKGAAYVFYGGPGANEAPDLVLQGAFMADNFGTSVASAGDMNGDGFGDLIVGAWRAGTETGAARTGRAYVFFGGPGVDAVADLVLIGAASDDRFGISVSSAGDVNADGFSDVIVGAPNNDAGGTSAGRAYIYFGGTFPDATADRILGGLEGDAFGYSVSSAGDLNADGFADVAAGAYADGGTGRAYVFYGGPALDGAPDRVFVGVGEDDHFGQSVASVGDVNGDGDDDLIVGAVLNDAGGTDAGRAYLFYGGADVDEVPDLTFTGATAGDNFGISLAPAGDMNADGFGDLIIGSWTNDANGNNAGRAYIYFLGPAGDAVADITLTGEAPGDRFGISVAGAGDVNADGAADALVGAYFNDFAGLDVGRAYLLTTDLSAHPPFVTAPPTVNGNVDLPISFSVTASDADGDPILSFTASPLPSGATFTLSGTKTSGTVNWTPGALQLGTYLVTFTASNDLTGSAATSIVVTRVNHTPSLDPVADMSANEGETADQVLHGSDPDGDALTFGLASGPGFVSVTTVNATTGNLHIAPGFADAGSYAATVRADDGHGSAATRSLSLLITAANIPPVLTAPASIFGSESVLISFTVTAVDPDGNHVALGALNRPVGSLFVDFGNNSGAFTWTPGFGQMGTYTIRFTGRDDLGATATHDLMIVVDDVNRGPVAVPGGPYSGVVNVSITFNGTGSTDPDGSPLSHLWSFGDGTTATGVTPLHAYATGGTFIVTLTVDDGSLSSNASTTSTIQDIFPARSFTTNSNGTIRLGSGKAIWCAEVEPVNNAYFNTSVVLSTIVMKYGTGQILAQPGKVSIGADKDANGVDEMTTCFSKTELRALFAGFSKGTSTVTVTLEGDINTGGRFRTNLTVDIVNNSGTLAASLSPNPLRTAASLTFRTLRSGRVSASIFDLNGRRVRTLLPGVELGAGYHDFQLDARNEHGERLPSGVYFYRVEAAEGSEAGRFVIAK